MKEATANNEESMMVDIGVCASTAEVGLYLLCVEQIKAAGLADKLEVIQTKDGCLVREKKKKKCKI